MRHIYSCILEIFSRLTCQTCHDKHVPPIIRMCNLSIAISECSQSRLPRFWSQIKPSLRARNCWSPKAARGGTVCKPCWQLHITCPKRAVIETLRKPVSCSSIFQWLRDQSPYWFICQNTGTHRCWSVNPTMPWPTGVRLWSAKRLMALRRQFIGRSNGTL